MLDYSVATLEVLPPNSDSHPARALILPANFLEVTQPGHGTEAVAPHELGKREARGAGCEIFCGVAAAPAIGIRRGDLLGM